MLLSCKLQPTCHELGIRIMRKSPFVVAASLFSSTSSLELTPVQSTALLTAYWRHQETISSGLIHDETATTLIDKLLATETRLEFDKSPIYDLGVDCLAIRTKFIDDWLISAKDEERSIVNLGAGMCGRPYRLNFHHNNYYELDSDLSVLRIKHQVLEEAGFQASCAAPVSLVGANLEDLEATAQTLKKAVLMPLNTGDESIPTDWIAEGLLEYLDPVTVHPQLLQMVYDFSAPKSRMILQLLEPPVADLFLQKLGAKLPWKPLVEASAFCEQAKEIGWDCVTVVDHNQLAKKYNRPLEMPGYNIICLEKE